MVEVKTRGFWALSQAWHMQLATNSFKTHGDLLGQVGTLCEEKGALGVAADKLGMKIVHNKKRTPLRSKAARTGANIVALPLVTKYLGHQIAA